MRKLLILSALFTGHGHKSVADALEERLAIYDDIEVKTIDGFCLMNRVEQYMAEYTYGPITRMPGKAWEWNYAGEIDYVKENLAALSERTWNLFRTDDNAEFRQKLYRILPLADRLAPHISADDR